MLSVYSPWSIDARLPRGAQRGRGDRRPMTEMSRRRGSFGPWQCFASALSVFSPQPQSNTWVLRERSLNSGVLCTRV